MICYDPHNASAFLSDLEAMGFDSISVTQTAKELNDATVDFRLEILAGNVEIEGMEVGKEGNKIVVPVDSLLVWSIANAKTISNNYGEIKIDKDITTERIDPIDAIIDAWKHAMKEEYRPDVNETVNEWLEQFAAFIFTVVMIFVFLRMGSEPSTLIENVFRFLSVEGGAMALIKSVKTVKGTKSNGEIQHNDEPEQDDEEVQG